MKIFTIVYIFIFFQILFSWNQWDFWQQVKNMLLYKRTYFIIFESMSLKKINLSALSGQTTTQATISEVDAPKEIDEIKTEKIITQITEEKLEEKIEILQTEETSSIKRKISLKDLKKSHTTMWGDFSWTETKKIQEENHITPIKKEETLTIQPIVEAVTAPSELEKVGEEKMEKIEDISTPIQEQEIVIISDGDTTCNIVKEEKSEIFWNYQWSFSKKDPSEEKVKEEIIETLSEKIEPEAPKIERKADTQNTNLERYAQAEEKTKKSTKKKIFISGLASIFALSIPSVMFLQWGFLKSNVSELPQNTTTQQKVIDIPSIEIQNPPEMEMNTPPETKHIPQENIENIETQISPEIQIENNQVWNNEIVKENIENEVANEQKNTKIDEKLQNYLLQKYKK